MLQGYIMLECRSIFQIHSSYYIDHYSVATTVRHRSDIKWQAYFWLVDNLALLVLSDLTSQKGYRCLKVEDGKLLMTPL